jgi:hypothetical protein
VRIKLKDGISDQKSAIFGQGTEKKGQEVDGDQFEQCLSCCYSDHFSRVMNGHVADGSALLSEAKFGICADINHERPGSRKPGIWARVSVSFAFSNLLEIHGRSTSIDAVN